MKYGLAASVLLILLCLGLFCPPCAGAKVSFPGFDLEGHRGARDLYPENTLPAFKYALDLGVTTLEMDCQITKDGIPVLSHNPRLENHLAKDADGAWVRKDHEPIIHSLTLAEVKRYDVGAINSGAKDYYQAHGKTQKALAGTRMPTLDEVFQAVEASGNKSVLFNIETKSYADRPTYDYGPDPSTFAQAILDVVRKHHMEDRVMIQSFDWRTLLEVRRLNKNITIVALTSDSPDLSDGLMRETGKEGCSPWMAGFDIDDFHGDYMKAAKAINADVVSPYYREVTKVLVDEAHGLAMKVVPWTVNKKEEMVKLIEMGVDGIITDRPDILKALLIEKKIRFSKER
jgi:glycerophosphoryl diester phosphodiesterase